MYNKILVIGAHTDDIEVMCGGTVARFTSEKREVHYSTFSFANKSLPEGVPDGKTADEVSFATAILEIPISNLHLYDYEVRVFPTYRQDILENLIELKKELNPDLVITHNADDMHQDHKIISDETYRAFKQSASIWGFESLKNNRVFHNDLYVKLSGLQIERKLQAISMYKSQIVKGDNRAGILGLAQFRGAQIHTEYAECFQVLRGII